MKKYRFAQLSLIGAAVLLSMTSCMKEGGSAAGTSSGSFFDGLTD